MRIQEGMTFTIEPVVNQGKEKVKTKKDGWTVVTADKKLSAQWEHGIKVKRSTLAHKSNFVIHFIRYTRKLPSN